MMNDDLEDYPHYAPTEEMLNAPNFDADSLVKFMNTRFPKPEYIWENFIARGDFACLAGDTGIGKTLIAQLMSYSLSRGQNFANLEVSKPRRVFYIDAEMSQADFQARLAKVYENSHLDNFYYLNCLAKEEFIDLTNEVHRTALMNRLEDLDIDLVILDNMFALSAIKDFRRPEEFVEGMKPFIHALRKAGISCLLLDHLNKEGSIFGSIAKIIFVDTVIVVTKIEEGHFTFELLKQRRQGIKEQVRFTISDDNVVEHKDIGDYCSPEQFVTWLDNNYHEFYPKPHKSKAKAISAMFKAYDRRYERKDKSKYISELSYEKNYAKKWNNS